MSPVRHQIAAPVSLDALDRDLEGRLQNEGLDFRVGVGAEHAGFHGQRVPARKCPIRSESTSQRAFPTDGGLARGIRERPPVKVLYERAIMAATAERSAVAEGAKRLALVAGAGGGQRA